ncbi:hypothetical protein [Microbacterium sp. SS28]|uniref:hypothetical protein n=1 Tax=Microbacterium sp. SS28 TaxID=2919948 RepID=UPI001FAA0F6B|nr:hypothetical protein [Microbacterium sp. SS28]
MVPLVVNQVSPAESASNTSERVPFEPEYAELNSIFWPLGIATVIGAIPIVLNAWFGFDGVGYVVVAVISTLISCLALTVGGWLWRSENSSGPFFEHWSICFILLGAGLGTVGGLVFSADPALYWPALPAAVAGSALALICAIRWIQWRTRSSQLERRRERRERVREHTAFWTILALLELAASAAFAILAVRSGTPLLLRPVYAAAAILFGVLFIRFISTVVLMRRYRWDQDLERSGLPELARMKSQLLMTQKSLANLTNNIHIAVVQVDDLFDRARVLEQEANDAREFLNLSQGQRQAILRNMNRGTVVSVWWTITTFLLGVGLTFALFALTNWQSVQDLVTAISEYLLGSSQ